jgi:hypothetical protein
MKWLCVFLLFGLQSGKTSFKVVYQVEASSRLFLNGSTSINNYQCYCTDRFPANTLSAEINASNKTISFTGAGLLIKTKLLNCKNKLMNRDMHKALKADEHPFIEVALLEVTAADLPAELQLNTWYEYKAKAQLTIAGVSKPATITVQVKKISPHLFRLLAAKNLYMSEFHVKPRTPFNMIKIDDLVTINFDMTVVVNEK